VTPGNFATLGVTLKSGRDFSERDSVDVPHTVIINETFARLFFPNQDPIGQKLMTGMAQLTAEVVGVVSDTRSASLNKAASAEYFLPVLQRPENFTALIVRTEGDPAAIGSSVRAALQQVDPALPLINPQTYNAMIAGTVADRRLAMMLLTGFAGLALILAGIGVYSVMAYVVTQRTSEIGIRIALGASPTQVLTLVLGQGMKLVVLGIVSGLIAAFAFSQAMEKLLFGVHATDPLIYTALAAAIVAIAGCACLLPARRATKVDPIVALRSE
jgi:predicted permease